MTRHVVHFKQPVRCLRGQVRQVCDQSGKEVGAIAIPVALAEHDARLQARLRDALSSDPEILVVAASGTASAAAHLTVEQTVRVLVLGASIRRDEALAALEAVTELAPKTRCLVIMNGADAEEQNRALMAGAAGVLPSRTAPARVADAVHALNAGEAVVPPPLLADLLQRFRSATLASRTMEPAVSPLSSREWQIMTELAAGRTTAATAQRLNIALATVHSHLRNIYRKLGVGSRAEALAAAEYLLRERRPAAFWTGVRPCS